MTTTLKLILFVIYTLILNKTFSENVNQIEHKNKPILDSKLKGNSDHDKNSENLQHETGIKKSNKLVKKINGTLVDDYKILTNAVNGAGEMGSSVIVPDNITGPAKIINENIRTKIGLNQYASDMIGKRRSLPDLRDKRCLKHKFPEALPQADIILTFHQEPWTILQRTINSILDRTPTNLIGKIIIIDDSSSQFYAKTLKEHWNNEPKIQVIRTKSRQGIIKSKMLAFKHSSAPIIMFLDSYTECAQGWLEPLLQIISKNSTTIACPSLNYINPDTFELIYSETHVFIGGFTWDLSHHWQMYKLNGSENKDTLSIPSATSTKGSFAVHRDFFIHLGKYNPNFLYSNVENLELSFKAWMCGGRIEIALCSHIGLIGIRRPEKRTEKIRLSLKSNKILLAKLWLDEYAEYFDENLFGIKNVQHENVVRDRLRCKNFNWYINNVYREAFIPNKVLGSGEIRNLDTQRPMCLDRGYGIKVHFSRCHGHKGNQLWFYSKSKEIRSKELCVGAELTLEPCHGGFNDQLWNYNRKTGQLRQGFSNNCLSLNYEKYKLGLEKCNSQNDVVPAGQRWSIENYNETKIIGNSVVH